MPRGIQHVSPEEAEPELEKKVQIMFPDAADVGLVEGLQRLFLNDLAAPHRRDLLEDRGHVYRPQRPRTTVSQVHAQEERRPRHRTLERLERSRYHEQNQNRKDNTP